MRSLYVGKYWHPYLWSSMGTSEAASNGSGAISPSGSSTPASVASTADIWATNPCQCSSCMSGNGFLFARVRDTTTSRRWHHNRKRGRSSRRRKQFITDLIITAINFLRAHTNCVPNSFPQYWGVFWVMQYFLITFFQLKKFYFLNS